MRTVTVRVTEEHISFTPDPLASALRESLPGAEQVTVDQVMLGEPMDVHVTLRRRAWRRSRTVTVRAPEVATELAYFKGNFPEAAMPATFTIRVPRRAVT